MRDCIAFRMTRGRGKASGVGIFTRGSRLTALHSQWSHELWESGRVSDAVLTLKHCQIRVIGVYGVHSGEPDSKALNELILSEVFRNANAFLLPTLILGDFKRKPCRHLCMGSSHGTWLL